MEGQKIIQFTDHLHITTLFPIQLWILQPEQWLSYEMPIVADIFHKHIENSNMSGKYKHLNNIEYYHTYVNEILILYQGTTDTFTAYLNNLDPNLKFRTEIKINNSINYLDLTITKVNM